MRLGAGDLASARLDLNTHCIGDPNKVPRNAWRCLRLSAGLAPSRACLTFSFCGSGGPEPRTRKSDLAALHTVHNACQSSRMTDVEPRTRGIPDYDVRMPFTVWACFSVEDRDPHRDSRPLGGRSRGPNLVIESQLFATPKHRQSSPSNLSATHDSHHSDYYQCFSCICALLIFRCSFACPMKSRVLSHAIAGLSIVLSAFHPRPGPPFLSLASGNA
jgi:hypothetical protein